MADLADPSASGRQRLWAIEQEADTVRAISKQDFTPRFPRVSHRVAKLMDRPLWLKDHRRLAWTLLHECDALQPDVIWIEWPREITCDSIVQIRRTCPTAMLVSFQDDNPWGHRKADRWQWRSYLEVAPLFDLHLVKRESDIENLTALGAKQCRMWEHGVFPPLFHPPQDEGDRTYPISFVGTCMDQRAAFIGNLLDAGLPIHVFGSHWKKRSTLAERYPENFHPPVRGEAYADVLRRSKIGLGIVSESNCDEWTMRTYEVPACGAMLLAQRTPTHERWFGEGVEAEFFTNEQDCIRHAKSLLGDPERREAIAKAGQEKCQQLGTLQEKVADLFREIQDGLL